MWYLINIPCLSAWFSKYLTFNYLTFAARKTIFYFSGRYEKMVFPKKSRGNTIFLVLSGKIMFLFTKNIIWRLRPKIKDDLSQKNTRKYDIFFKLSEKMVFWKRAARGHDLSCIVWKDNIFSPKTWYFFLGLKLRNNLPQEIHGNKIFSVYTYGCYKRGATSLCQRNQRRSYPAKIHLKVIDVLDWQRAPAILCTFMEAFTGVFMYRSPAKKKRKLNT